MNFALTEWPLLDHSIWTVATIAAGFAVGFLINRIVINRLQKLAAQTAGDWDDAVVLELRRRIPFWGVLAGLWFSIGYWPLSGQGSYYARNIVSALAVLSVTTALAGIAARSRVFVSNDSGAMHLAAAIGRPVVAIFGPTDERATGPIGAHEIVTARAFCRPCLLRDCPIDHRCMNRISADTVFAAVSKQLALAV